MSSNNVTISKDEEEMLRQIEEEQKMKAKATPMPEASPMEKEPDEDDDDSMFKGLKAYFRGK